MEKGGEKDVAPLSLFVFGMVGTLNGGLCAVLTLGVMGSGLVISSPPYCQIPLPPAKPF